MKNTYNYDVQNCVVIVLKMRNLQGAVLSIWICYLDLDLDLELDLDLLFEFVI